MEQTLLLIWETEIVQTNMLIDSLRIFETALTYNCICEQYILKAKSNFTLFIYIPFQDICE